MFQTKAPQSCPSKLSITIQVPSQNAAGKLAKHQALNFDHNYPPLKLKKNTFLLLTWDIQLKRVSSWRMNRMLHSRSRCQPSLHRWAITMVKGFVKDWSMKYKYTMKDGESMKTETSTVTQVRKQKIKLDLKPNVRNVKGVSLYTINGHSSCSYSPGS